MKLVTAIIKPFKLEEVRESLTRIGIPHLSLTEIQGYGRQRGKAALYRGSEYESSFLPKVKIEIAVDEQRVDEVVDTIMHAARTGAVGDGKIFVSPIEQALRIRTGETGLDALS